MNIRLRFPLRRPCRVIDHWQLDANGAELTFETKGSEVTAFIVTYRNQPVELAPRLGKANDGTSAQLNIAGSIEAEGRRLIKRFVDYASLYFSLDVNTDVVEAEYIPVDDTERARIEVFSFKSSKERPTSHLPFDLLSQAFFAAESPDDPSFVARMLHLAREELFNDRYIDAFRYSFLLLEALYGDGKFRARDVVRAFMTDDVFERTVTQLLESVRRGPPDRSGASSLAESFPTAEALIKHLVDRRGFYFHGNLSHTSSWHPANQQEAAPLAEFCVRLAALVAQNHAGAMFSPNMNARVIANARRYGAIMTIQVHYEFVDQQNVPRKAVLNINMAGTKPTSPLAIQAHKGFLEWAELNLSNATLISAVAVDKTSGAAIFQSRYLSSEAQEQ